MLQSEKKLTLNLTWVSKGDYTTDLCSESMESRTSSWPDHILTCDPILHSSKILTIQQGITRGVSSVGKPCRPEHRFPRPNCPGNAPIFKKYVLCVTVWFRLCYCWINNPPLTLQLLSGRLNTTFVLDLSHASSHWNYKVSPKWRINRAWLVVKTEIWKSAYSPIVMTQHVKQWSDDALKSLKFNIYWRVLLDTKALLQMVICVQIWWSIVFSAWKWQGMFCHDFRYNLPQNLEWVAPWPPVVTSCPGHVWQDSSFPPVLYEPSKQMLQTLEAVL